MVDTRRERVRKFQLEVYSLSADTADRLRRVYLFLVAVELRPLSAVMVGALIRLCHTSPAFGYKNSTSAVLLNVSSAANMLHEPRCEQAFDYSAGCNIVHLVSSPLPFGYKKTA